MTRKLASAGHSAGRTLILFLELFFFGRPETRGRTQGLAIIEKREVAHVQGNAARGRLALDDDGYRTAFDAVPEGDDAAAGEPCVSEPFGHVGTIIYQSKGVNSASISFSKFGFDEIPVCFAQILPSREMITVTGMPQNGP